MHRSRWTPSLGAWFEEGRVHFKVWAPQRKSVHVLLEQPHQPLLIIYPAGKELDAEGLFSGVHFTAKPGDLYRYRLDGKNAYPDPASHFQPHGVHGPLPNRSDSARRCMDRSRPGAGSL